MLNDLDFVALAEHVFPTYSLDEVIRFVLMLDVLREKGIFPGQLTDAYLLYQQKQAQRQLKPKVEAPPLCPMCSKPLMLRHIGTPKGKGNIYGWKSLVFCTNPECLFEKYYKTTVTETLIDILARRKAGQMEVEDGNC